MAAVDSLLALLASQGASALHIVSSGVPALESEEGVRALSMPEVSAEIVASFVQHVFAASDRERLLARGRLSAIYEAGDGVRFAVDARLEEGDYRLVFRRAEYAVENAVPNEATNGTEKALELPDPDSPGNQDAHSLISMLLREAASGASDVILSSGSQVWVRQRGELRSVAVGAYGESQLRELLGEALTPSADEALNTYGSIDLALAVGDEQRRFRANVFRQQRGLAVALRPVRSAPPTLAELGLPQDLEALGELRSGLVLMTGPTGSGKSTTLVALIEALNSFARVREAGRHIITLEDPIEYEYSPGQCLIHQRELGRHVPSFAAGLRSALREDPDVILVGEMRDAETFAAALTAAETGHLVLSTLHSGSASMVIERIVDGFPSHQQSQVSFQLSNCLRAIVTQHLLPRKNGRGLLPVLEKLVITSAAANLIREGRVHQLPSLIQTGREAGMVPMELSLAQRVRDQEIDLGVARAAARDPVVLEHFLSR